MMKVKYIHFMQPNRAINYGIGTYIENIICCFRDIGCDFEVVELLSLEADVKSANSDGYRKISIPALSKCNTMDMYRNYYSRNTAFLLKTFFSEEDIFYVFHLNCMDNEYLPIWLKKL
jgi:hypothetical protein